MVVAVLVGSDAARAVIALRLGLCRDMLMPLHCFHPRAVPSVIVVRGHVLLSCLVTPERTCGSRGMNRRCVWGVAGMY